MANRHSAGHRDFTLGALAQVFHSASVRSILSAGLPLLPWSAHSTEFGSDRPGMSMVLRPPLRRLKLRLAAGCRWPLEISHTLPFYKTRSNGVSLLSSDIVRLLQKSSTHRDHPRSPISPPSLPDDAGGLILHRDPPGTNCIRVGPITPRTRLLLLCPAPSL